MSATTAQTELQSPTGHVLASSNAWIALKRAAGDLQQIQVQDGSIPDPADHDRAQLAVDSIAASIFVVEVCRGIVTDRKFKFIAHVSNYVQVRT